MDVVVLMVLAVLLVLDDVDMVLAVLLVLDDVDMVLAVLEVLDDVVLAVVDDIVLVEVVVEVPPAAISNAPQSMPVPGRVVPAISTVPIVMLP